jgi:Zn-dependent protease
MSNHELLVGALSLAFLVLSLGIHEAAHAWAAWRCGDSTAKDMGRMTLDPIPHIDPIMTILVPIILFVGTSGTMMFGGAKPVPVAYHRLRNPLRDMSLVALAGPLSNILLAILFMLIWKVLYYGVGFASNEVACQVMRRALEWNILLAAFNMIPIPPLDGSRVMTWLLPAGLRERYNSLERHGIFLVMILLYIGPLQPVIRGLMEFMVIGVEFITLGSWR